MLINQKQFKNVMVETQSGQMLGYLADFDLETDTGTIEKYYVKSKNLMAGIFEGKLIINKSQVISFNNEKMVVEDNVIKEMAKNVIPKTENLESIEPVMSSKLGE